MNFKEGKRKNFKEKLDEARNERVYTAIQFVLFKRQKYKEKYCVFPRFVKIPIWLDEDFEELDEKLFGIINSTPTSKKTWLGLIVCPTESIKTTEEIEVF